MALEDIGQNLPPDWLQQAQKLQALGNPLGANSIQAGRPLWNTPPVAQPPAAAPQALGNTQPQPATPPLTGGQARPSLMSHLADIAHHITNHPTITQADLGTGAKDSAQTPVAAPQPSAQPLPPPLSQGGSTPAQSELGRLTAPRRPDITDPGTGLTLPGAPEHSPENTGTSGINQIKNPWARIPLQVLDAIGGTVAPRLTSNIPGTQLHHQQLVGQATRNVNEEQGVQNEESKRQLEAAETERALHPGPKEEPEGKTIETAEGVMQWNPATHRYDIRAGSPYVKPAAEKTQYHVLPGGEVVSLTIGDDGKSHAEVVYKGTPAVKTEVKQLEVSGKPHQVLINSATGEQIKDLGETGEKPPNIHVESGGTWSVQEDAEGKPVLLNNKTGETKAAPAGVQKTGTLEKHNAAIEKHNAAIEKQIGPGRDALSFANDYLKNGVFTGPGDEALQEKFFELAKPSVGFRMTQPQITQLKNSASLLNQLRAAGKHATSGGWFADEQRQQIVNTMQQLYDAKLKGLQGGGAPASGPAQTDPSKMSDEELMRALSGKK